MRKLNESMCYISNVFLLCMTVANKATEMLTLAY